MKVLLLSAYDAQSHRRWRNVLSHSFSDYDWTVLTLAPRYFSWRIRGNSMSWAFTQRDTLEQHYDLVIATSMVDLSALRGFVPELTQCPTLLYFHENQFAYPASKNQFLSIEPKVLNLYSALAADYIAFNSAYNRTTFLHGVSQLLFKMPDHVPPGIAERLESKSTVLPVPLEKSFFLDKTLGSESQLSIVWNHRWEYDKAPDRLFAALQIFFEEGLEMDLYIIGQQFRKVPPVFEQIKEYFACHYPHCLKRWGYVESEKEYREILNGSDIIVSTALHDFQGLAVLEGVAAACVPLLPDRLCYAEWFKQANLYPSFPDDPVQESKALAKHLIRLHEQKILGELPSAPDVRFLAIDSLRESYQQIFTKTIDEHSHRHRKSVS